MRDTVVHIGRKSRMAVEIGIDDLGLVGEAENVWIYREGCVGIFGGEGIRVGVKIIVDLV